MQSLGSSGSGGALVSLAMRPGVGKMGRNGVWKGECDVSKPRGFEFGNRIESKDRDWGC